MSEQESDYYRRRARTERERARSSETPEAAGVHRELARLFEALLCPESASSSIPEETVDPRSNGAGSLGCAPPG